MDSNYKIKEIMDWWNQYKDIDINIKTNNDLFYIKLNNELLPHLLGLQYTSPVRKKYSGKELYKFCYGKSDEEIFNLIIKYNLKMLQSVSDRVDTFKYFMENLEKGIVVENTNSDTKIKSQNFIVEYKDNKILHLGLLNVAGEDAIVEYGVIDRKLETYFLSKNTNYFKDTSIKEEIKSIEKYNDKGELEPFSFSDKKIEELQYDENLDMYMEEYTEENDLEEFEDKELSFTKKL